MQTTSSPILLALAVSVNVVSASEGGGDTVRSQKYECTDGITQIDYFTTDCTGEVAPLSANPSNPGDGVSLSVANFATPRRSDDCEPSSEL